MLVTQKWPRLHRQPSEICQDEECEAQRMRGLTPSQAGSAQSLLCPSVVGRLGFFLGLLPLCSHHSLFRLRNDVRGMTDLLETRPLSHASWQNLKTSQHPCKIDEMSDSADEWQCWCVFVCQLQCPGQLPFAPAGFGESRQKNSPLPCSRLLVKITIRDQSM